MALTLEIVTPEARVYSDTIDTVVIPTAQGEIGILPVWVCPTRGDAADRPFPLYPLQAAPLYVNFGFWDVVETEHPGAPGHFNRLVEQEVMRLGGIKSLYSDSFFPEEEFGRLYGGDFYRALKAKYDPGAVFPDLYRKCVLRH